jgi:hypothetical protein
MEVTWRFAGEFAVLGLIALVTAFFFLELGHRFQAPLSTCISILALQMFLPPAKTQS